MGAMPHGVLLGGVHLRPMDGAEVGVGVNMPFPMFFQPTPMRPEPALEVKLYRWPAGATVPG